MCNNLAALASALDYFTTDGLTRHARIIDNQKWFRFHIGGLRLSRSLDTGSFDVGALGSFASQPFPMFGVSRV